MPAGSRFATGKYAWGICDICGVRWEFNELRFTTIRGRSTNLKSCPICWDPDHPQNFLPDAITVDAEALRQARPEDYYQSRILIHWRPSDSFPVPVVVAPVTVVTT